MVDDRDCRRDTELPCKRRRGTVAGVVTFPDKGCGRSLVAMARECGGRSPRAPEKIRTG